MPKKSLILIGGGGHCKSCVDVIEAEGKFKIAGIIDTEDRLHQDVLGYKITAVDKDLQNLIRSYKYFLITIGSIKEPRKRIEKFEYLKALDAKLPVIISSLAHVSRSARIAEGTIVMHKALVNSDAYIGKNCIINTSVLIEHDAKIGDHCHISTGSIINGKCKIGNRVFIGSNSVVANNINIADDVVVGAGSVVVKTITKAGVYVGNPARPVKKEG